MQIRYKKPLDTENINLSFTFATLSLIGLLFINFNDALSTTALTRTLCNIVLIPILFLTLVFIVINYYDHATSKKSLNQIISEYINLSKLPLDDEKFRGFYIDENELSLYNYKPIREMPKNVASCFMEEKDQPCK